MEVGDIIKFSPSEIPERNFKFGICIHPELFWALLINSKNREMYDCIPIKKGDVFPEYDSYIGCKNIFTLDDSCEPKHICKAPRQVIEDILQKVQGSRFIARRKKLAIIDAIKNHLNSQ